MGVIDASLSLSDVLESSELRIGKLFEIIETGIWAYDMNRSYSSPSKSYSVIDHPLRVGDSFVLCSIGSWYKDYRTVQMQVLLGSQIKYILVDKSYFGPESCCQFFKELV